jgi:uncharacterized protein
VLVTPDQVAAFAEALGTVSFDHETFRLTARATLICRREDLATFERVFERFWNPDGRGVSRRALSPARAERGHAETTRPDGEESSPPELLAERAMTYSPGEDLRHKRFEDCSEDELRTLKQFILRFSWQPPERRTRRLSARRSGPRFDLARTLRRAMRQGGELTRLHWRSFKRKPRPLVVLLDISGSMERYARMLLIFLYALRRTEPLEAFVFGTRLTRVTPALGLRHADLALAMVGQEARDWSGGTRIGESLLALRRRWAKLLSRNAVVMLVSDGWDQGDPALLSKEMARLQRRCHRLIWLNPLLGTPGYAPLTRGMQAALPFVDDFLPVHNLRSLEDLALHLASLPSRRPPRRSGGSRIGTISNQTR